MLKPIARVGEHTLPPDGAGTARAYSRIGYELEEALADLIDNSIDAGARRVEISFFRSRSAITAVTIADDGAGMTADRLRDGMRFAGQNHHNETDLGTYGMGMKSASFSQCRSMTVISRSGLNISACRWTVESVKSWRCEILDPAGAAEHFRTGYMTGRQPATGGTLILWEDLDRMETAPGDGDLDEFLGQLLARLEIHLGLVFHRFIARGDLSIHLSVRQIGQRLHIPRPVRAHDPFGYPKSGSPKYPKVFVTSMPGIGELQLTAHIWPARSAETGFLLGRRTGTPGQGFYFYRSDRLIQAGGWNDVLRDTSDPELSLARVAIELPPGKFDVTVQKSAVQLTAAASHSLARAKAGKTTLNEYFEDVRKTYRTSRLKPKAAGELPMTLGAGVPVTVRERVQRLVAKKGPTRPIDFAWQSLPAGTVIDLEPSEDLILLNSKYRSQILGGVRGSIADAPLFKALVFLLLRHDLSRLRQSQQRAAWLEECNKILFTVVRSL